MDAFKQRTGILPSLGDDTGDGGTMLSRFAGLGAAGHTARPDTLPIVEPDVLASRHMRQRRPADPGGCRKRRNHGAARS